MGTKACPFCAETIQEAAIKCRFCGSELPAAPQRAAPFPLEAPISPAPATTSAGAPRKGPLRQLFDIVIAVASFSAAMFVGLFVVGVGYSILKPGLRDSVGLVSIKVIDAKSEGCGRLLDVCVRAKCTLQNTADTPASGRLEFSYSSDGRTTVSSVELVELGPKQKRVFTHEFPEAEFFDEKSEVRCGLR